VSGIVFGNIVAKKKIKNASLVYVPREFKEKNENGTLPVSMFEATLKN
jgi:hypothetical protein